MGLFKHKQKNNKKIDQIKPVFTFKIGGEAGYGIMSAGLTFSKIACRSGYYVFDYTEYPSIIRGGHNVMQTTFSKEVVRSQSRQTNFLVALNQNTVDLHKGELIDGAGLLYDAEQGIDIKGVPKNVQLFNVPINRLAREVGGSEIMRNTAALGATMGLLGGELSHLRDLITAEFGAKKPEVVEKNHATGQAGYDFVVKNYQAKIKPVLPPTGQAKKLLVISGNEAAALGAIAAGMQFASIYPMTPTSGILHALAPLQEQFGFIYKQPEDEIAAINMAIGASYAGARAMTATSGGGFCLMTEGYGLAGITETPLVIVEGMRGSPSTGLPTWTEQGDLKFVLHAHQGEFPKIILAAGDVEEVFELIGKAFNLADIYQTPVVLLVDKHICESHQSVPPFAWADYQVERGQLLSGQVDNYARYEITPDGISPRALPGQGNHFVANSDEHDTTGYSNEEAEVRQAQMDKRMKKLETCAQADMEAPKLYGPKEAEITLVSWGSNKGAILDALKNFSNVNFLHITWISPFPTAAVRKVLKKAKHIINLECNYSGQMAALIREKTGLEIKDNLLKYDGRPIYPEEIVEKIKSIKLSN